MFRDLGYYWLRLGIYIALCISSATIFNGLDKSYGSIQVINNEDFSSSPLRFFYTPHKSHFASENGGKYEQKNLVFTNLNRFLLDSYIFTFLNFGS
jgi:hypothetical protein